MVIKNNIYLKKIFFELDWIKNNSDFRLMVIKVVDWSHVLGTYLSLTDSEGQKPGKGEKRRFSFLTVKESMVMEESRGRCGPWSFIPSWFGCEEDLGSRGGLCR